MSRAAGSDPTCECQDGFTLLELLIALALLSLIATIWLGGLHLAGQVWSGTEAKADALNDVEAVRDFFRREIDEAYPAWRAGADTVGHVVFSGATQQLTLIAPMPAALEVNEMARISLYLSGPANNRSLVMDWQPAFDEGWEEPRGASGRQVLLQRVATVEFGYFGSTAPLESPQWRTDWPAAGVFPRLVRMRVGFPKGDDRNWPELVVKPMISQDADCVFDPVSRACRGR